MGLSVNRQIDRHAKDELSRSERQPLKLGVKGSQVQILSARQEFRP